MEKGKTVKLLQVMLYLAACTVLTGCGEKELPYEGFRPVGDKNIMMDTSQWGELNTHDPSIIKEKDTYYVFSTDASYGNVHEDGIQIRKSKDLITWEYVGTAFDNFEEDCAEAISWAKLDVSQHEGLWAPDIVKVGNTYRLYYSASTFGSTRSCIGLAESKNIEGPYIHKGIVYQSEENASVKPNAIDPAIITDKEGNSYMSYGSFFGGIFIAMLEEGTGMLKEGVEPVRIAGSRGAGVEGSCITYAEETGYYYLFVSYGSLSSDYNVRVGRSKVVTGPYQDANGNRMDSLGAGNEEKIGTKILGGYQFAAEAGTPQSKGYMAPGHNSVLKDNDSYYMIHHTRTYSLPDYWFYMNIRGMSFNRFAWPVVYPNRYHGETLEAAWHIEGMYGLVEHLSDNNGQAHQSQKVTLQDGKITGDITGTYILYEKYRIEMIVAGKLYDGIVINGYDWEREKETVSVTVMSEDGRCIWLNAQ